jgi:hypothetical protein
MMRGQLLFVVVYLVSAQLILAIAVVCPNQVMLTECSLNVH